MRDNQFKDSVPTVGLNIEHLTHKRYSITFWDVGGQATKLWKHYFDKIDAVIFVIDSTDEEKLLFARDEFHRILRDENLTGIPVLILYNKKDLTSKTKSQEYLNSKLDVDTLKKDREIVMEDCSAISGTGIWEGIDKLIAVFEGKQDEIS